MACHNHGRREKTLADILTRQEMNQLWDNLNAWRDRTIREVQLEACRCQYPWPEYLHGGCPRCQTLGRFNRKCCNENGPIRPSL